VSDERETIGWGERAVNQVAKLVISRLVVAEQIDIWVDTTLPKTMRGEIDAISIALQGFSVRPDLLIETFQLQINQVVIVPKLAIRGTIHLVQPASGKLKITLREEHLTNFLSNQFINQRSPSFSSQLSSLIYRIHQISVSFAATNQLLIALNWASASTDLYHSTTLLLTPEITSEGQTVNLAMASVSGQAVPTELATDILLAIAEILNLEDFKQQGTAFQVRQLEISREALAVYADAVIHQIPAK